MTPLARRATFTAGGRLYPGCPSPPAAGPESARTPCGYRSASGRNSDQRPALKFEHVQVGVAGRENCPCLVRQEDLSRTGLGACSEARSCDRQEERGRSWACDSGGQKRGLATRETL